MTDAEKGLLGLGHKLIGNLPAQFLILCLINLIFVGAIVWLLDRAAEHRQALLAPIIAACIERVQR